MPLRSLSRCRPAGPGSGLTGPELLGVRRLQSVETPRTRHSSGAGNNILHEGVKDIIPSL